MTGIRNRAEPNDGETLCADALDFAPDLLAIQERPPARLPRALAGTTVAFVLSLLSWSTLAEVDVIASAPGRLVPMSFAKVVQAAESGVIARIHVREGEVVRQGQLLLHLDPSLARADGVALDGDVALARLTLRRIEAELTDRPFVPDGGEPPDLFRRVASLYRARRQAHADAVAEESETWNRIQAELRAAQQQLGKLARTLPSYRQSAEAYRHLMQEGFVGEIAAIEKAREATEKEQDLRTQEANLQALEAGIAQSQRRLAMIRSQYRSQLESERIDTLARLNRGVQELEKSKLRTAMLEIRAPNAGVIKDLAATTVGAVVAAGQTLMNVIPRGEPMLAELSLRNEDVGFVATGQVAKIKVAAYPFQKYGMLDGVVSLVSADAVDPAGSQPGHSEDLSYRAMVRLEANVLTSAATGEPLSLSPGMLVTAEIHQGTRSVLEYLLSPVRRVTQEAARER